MQNNEILIPKEKKTHLISVRLMNSSWKVLKDASQTFGPNKTEAIEAGLRLREDVMKKEKDANGSSERN